MLKFFTALVLTLGLATNALAENQLVVFAAASLKTAMDGAAQKFHAGGGSEVALSYGGSLGLARQLVAGAPADVFISADEPSMDAAAQGKAIKPDTRVNFLGNHLVLIAPKSAAESTLPLEAGPLKAALGSGKLATGEVNTVPVGRYAKESLTKLGLWDALSPSLAMTDNVRAALDFVARGEAPLGIVYQTDATADARVKKVAKFPDDTHAPIVYPLAIVASSHNPQAEKFVAFLRSPEAAELFKAQGFEMVQ